MKMQSIKMKINQLCLEEYTNVLDIIFKVINYISGYLEKLTTALILVQIAMEVDTVAVAMARGRWKLKMEVRSSNGHRGPP